MIRNVARLGLFLILTSFAAQADVRDDYRSCERNFLSKIRRGAEPQASTAEEEYCLGLGYWFSSSGNRLTRDPAKAAYWHTKAAANGSHQAQVALAYQYEKGYGVQTDIAKAVQLYRSAAEQNDASAMFNLGRMYSLGRGVEKNEAEADRWFHLAAEHGSAEARVHFRDSAQYSAEGAGRSDFEAGYKAYEKQDYTNAAILFEKAANAGNPSADVALGQLYRQGLGVAKNEKRAFELYQTAALKGHARAQAQLGLSYELGEGVSENWAEAVAWYKKSATQLDKLGLYYLARAYQFGIGVPQDRALATAWYEKAENQGEQQAGFFAKWLSNPKNCTGYVSDAERDKFAGICAEPKGTTFHTSAERRAWLVDQLNHVQVDMFGSNSYSSGACGASGGEFRSGNCYGSGGVIFNPGTQDREGRNLW